MPDPQMRAADADREAVAHRLAEHMAAGRLTVAEYEERVARTYAAKTYGDLAALTTDLPSSRPRPAAPVQAASAGACSPWGWGGAHWRRAAWASWSSTAAIVVAIWAITSIASGAFLYFWPIWVIGPWGAVLLAQSLGWGGAAPRDRDRHRDRGRLGA